MARQLAPGELLSVWERSRRLEPAPRALALARAAVDDGPESGIEAAPIGERDRALFKLRIANFGERAECYTACPQCASELESELDLPKLLIDPPRYDDASTTLATDGWSIKFRLPDSRDLIASSEESDPQGTLLRLCLLSATRDDQPVSASSLPGELLAMLEDEMQRLDPQSTIVLQMTCPDCCHAWGAVFDIAVFVWREIEVYAKRLLHEVDALARAYGWSEQEILSLTSQRRESYLALQSLA